MSAWHEAKHQFPLGSRWYAWGEHVEIVAHPTVDGEPGVREKLLTGPSKGKTRVAVLASLFARYATESDIR